MRPLLGTFVEIGACKNSHGCHAAVTAAFSKLEEVQRLLSFQNPDSDLSQLNSSPGQQINMNPISIIALHLARRMTLITGGLFNCTIGGKMIENGTLPNHNRSSSLSSGVAQDIEIHGRRVRLNRPLKITLDGLAKGLAVDLSVKTMKKMGVSSGWVNAGGDLRVFGNVSLPLLRREIDGSFSNLGTFHETAVATSVVRYQENPRYPGVIISGGSENPEYGCWTVIAKSAWQADALTKVSALASADQRQAIIKRFGASLLPSIRTDA